MSPSSPAGVAGRTKDPAWQASAIAGVALIAGLAVALGGRHGHVAGVALGAAGTVVAAFVLMPLAAGALRAHPGLSFVGIVGVLGLLWLVIDLTGTFRLGWITGTGSVRDLGTLGAGALLRLGAIALAAIGGLILIADALRLRLRMSQQRRPWEQMTAGERAGGVPWRAVAGVLLVGWAALVAVSVARPYVDGNPVLQLVVIVGIVAAAAVVIGTPIMLGTIARTGRDDAARRVEDERQRFAAHLHDSVLQTLALVQRQAHDPVAVARLARRQEHALRTWMAGETELASETLVSALRDAVAEVEDEERIVIELSAIGDRPLDPAGEAIAAAAREALRNAARHARGSAVVMFAEVRREGAEVFVRDQGPGFDPETVPSERRGIRDAIVGRMAAVGGSASVDAAAGEGTEVALRIGPLRDRGSR